MVQLRKQREQSLSDVRNMYQKMQEQIKEKEIQGIHTIHSYSVACYHRAFI